ncbi:MAG: hypothetical protein GXO88_02260, partial [Chlorobi bacterium]|nr:hypothetical protein [Chlorobiota bacterium]
MRKLLVIIIFCHLSSFSQTYFNNRYGASANSLDASRVIIYDNNNFIVQDAFVSSYSDNLIKLSMMKLNVFGYLTDTKMFIENELSVSQSRNNGSLKRFSSSSLYSVGVIRKYNSWVYDRGSLFKFDNSLDTIWTKKFGEAIMPLDTNYYFEHFDLNEAKDLIVIGEINMQGESSEVLLMKIDSSGNKKWERYYESGPFNLGTNVLSLPGGGYALSCFKWQFQSTISHNYLIRTDSLGNELWRRYIGGPLDDGPLFLAWSASDSTIVGAYHTADSALTNSDSYNRLALIKVDVDNNLVYDKKFMPEKDYDQWNFYVYGINIDAMNNIVVVGSTNEPVYHSEGYLFKFTNAGDSLWYRQYKIGTDIQTDHYLTGVTPAPDGGYAAVGYFIPAFSDTGNQDVWVIKVDSMGCISEGDCWLGNREITAYQSKEGLKIYANPSSGRINIEVPQDDRGDDYVLTIWDLYGRKADEVIVPPGAANVGIDISGWSPGLYTVVSASGGKFKGRGK